MVVMLKENISGHPWMLIFLNVILVVKMIVVRVEILYVELYLFHHKHELYLTEDSIHQLLMLNDHFEEDLMVKARKEIIL